MAIVQIPPSKNVGESVVDINNNFDYLNTHDADIMATMLGYADTRDAEILAAALDYTDDHVYTHPAYTAADINYISGTQQITPGTQFTLPWFSVDATGHVYRSGLEYYNIVPYTHPSYSDCNIGRETGITTLTPGETFTLPWVHVDTTGHVNQHGASNYNIGHDDSKADSTHTHAYLPLAGGTMTGMLKTQSLYVPYERNKSDANDNVPVSGAITTLNNIENLSTLKTFIGTMTTPDGAWHNIMSIRHRNGDKDGASYGMYLRTRLTADSNLAWNKQISASSWVGERILLDSNNYKTYITPANIGAASSTHNHDNTYLKKSAVTSQSVIYTSTTSANSATITGLFTNYSLIWLQAVGSKTTHTHVIPLNYLGSKSSLMFKDSGVPFNIIKDSDTSIRWFEYQGQGAETYTSVTIVKII